MDGVQAIKIYVQSPLQQNHPRARSLNCSQNQVDSGTVSEEGDLIDSNSENIYNMTRLQLCDWAEAAVTNNRLSNTSSDFEDVIKTDPNTPDIISSSEEDELQKRFRHNLPTSEHRRRMCKRGRHSSEEELLNIIGWKSPVRSFNNNSHLKISGKDSDKTLTELNGPRLLDNEVENFLYSIVDTNWNCGYYGDSFGGYYDDQISPRKRHCSSPPRPSLNFYKMQRTSIIENEFSTQSSVFSAKSLNDFHGNCKSSSNLPKFCFRSLAKSFI